jgi:hypothetical protein
MLYSGREQLLPPIFIFDGSDLGMRRLSFLGLVALILIVFSAPALSAPFDEVIQRWTKTKEFQDGGDYLKVTATYYSTEYIEALVQSEADKNLWTADELELHKYQLLKTLNLDETIPVKFEFEVKGASMHMAPFGDQVWIWLGGKRYKPADYDPRFNFKVSDRIEGMVHFPRFDEKTGRDLLEATKSVKVELSGGIYPAIRSIGVDFIWDVAKDDPERLFAGQSGARLEMDRLIKRLARLNREKDECEQKLNELNSEIATIEARMKELQMQ